jgi:hypothetical protein
MPDLDGLRVYEGDKISVKTLSIREEARDYLRVNLAGIYVGQLSSWMIYPQHRLPVEDTKIAMRKIHNWKFIHGSYRTYKQKDGDFLFIDPPYLGTDGNYGVEDLNIKTFTKWIKKLEVPYVLTYQCPIEAISNEWVCWLTKRVPRIRTGGSEERKDWYCKGNW